jgi:hypothetical protein
MGQISGSQFLNGIDGKPQKDGTDPEGIDYGRLVALLVEAIKEQQSQIRVVRGAVDHLRQTLGL